MSVKGDSLLFDSSVAIERYPLMQFGELNRDVYINYIFY